MWVWVWVWVCSVLFNNYFYYDNIFRIIVSHFGIKDKNACFYSIDCSYFESSDTVKRCKTLLDNRVIRTVFESLSCNQVRPFVGFIPTVEMYNNIVASVNDKPEMYNRLSSAFGINLLVVLSDGSTYYANRSNSSYTVFLFDNKTDVKLLTHNGEYIHHTPTPASSASTQSCWSTFISSLPKWEPVFAEIWNYFVVTGQHVPPIEWHKDKKGIKAFSIPFITSEYKKYLKHIGKSVYNNTPFTPLLL